VSGGLVGEAAYVVTAGYGADATLGNVTKLTSGKVSNGVLKLKAAKSLGYTAAFSGVIPAFVGAQLFVQRPDFAIQVASLSTSGKAGGLKPSPTPATGNGVLAGGIRVNGRVVLAFTQNGFGVCCSTTGTPTTLGSLGTGYPNEITVGVDKRKHVWVAWLDYAGISADGSTIRAVELDPATLAPKTTASKVIAGPFKGATTNVSGLTTTCGAVCHVVFGNNRNVYSWTAGDATARKIIGGTALFVGASVDRKNRLLTAYVKGAKLVIQRGDARGKGGKTTSAAIPSTENLQSPSASFTTSRVLVTMTEQLNCAFRTIAAVLPLP
jgi:hypothetical protein